MTTRPPQSFERQHPRAREDGLASQGGTPLTELESTRVVKKIKPSQPGAVKLARQYGESLVCVRYRHDAKGERRYTTVEVVIDCVWIQSRPVAAEPDPIVGVKIDFNERSLRSIVQASGGKWDAQAKLWKLPTKIAAQLGLLGRVVSK